jgi:integrase/recombinase XerD
MPEALALTTHAIVGGPVTLRKATTKGSSATRTLGLHPRLAKYLKAYNSNVGFLFSGRDNTKPLTRAQVNVIFKELCKRVRIMGASKHFMRGTTLTNLSNAGVPLRVIMEISEHKNLSSLQRYLEVQPEQLVKAIGLLK